MSNDLDIKNEQNTEPIKEGSGLFYNNEKVRRQDRLLEESEALKLLEHGSFGVLSLVDTDNTPYAVPINFCWDKGQHIYLHCGPAGRKLNIIAGLDGFTEPELVMNETIGKPMPVPLSGKTKASFCVVGDSEVVSNKFTTRYSSIIAKCEAEVGLDADERRHALRLFLEKYCPNDMEVGLKYIEKSFFRTDVIKLTIREFSGKAKKVATLPSAGGHDKVKPNPIAAFH